MRLLLPLMLALAVRLDVVQSAEDPRALVRAATRAVDGDSAGRLRSRLAARVARNPNDRAALLGLATLARLRYEYPTADSIYRRLFTNTRDRYALYARLGRAEGLELRSFSRDARPEFEHARTLARELGDRTAEGQALLWLTFIRGRLEGVAVAEATIDSTARLIPDSVHELWSQLRNRRAITHALRGRTADALSEARSSISLAQGARDPRAEADAFRVLGQVLQYRGQWDSALVALRQSQELYLKTHSRSALANSLIWHAQVLASMSRYGEMREVMRRGQAEGEATHNPNAVGDAQRAFGVLALMLGDWPAASTHLKRSAAISAATGDSSGLLTTTKFLASVALAAGDIATAKRLTLELATRARLTQDGGSVFETQRALADIAAAEGDWPAAQRALDNARAQLRTLPGANYRSWLTHDEARIALARGDLAAAERFLLAYLGTGARPTESAFRPFDARVRLADVYARRGDLARAENTLRLATDEIDQFRAKLSDGEMRTLVFQAAASTNAAAAEPTGSAAGVARVLAALATGGRAAAAFELAERWRARELIDRLTRNAALRAGEPQPTTAGSPASAPARSAADIASALPDSQTALIEFVASKGAPLTLFVVQRGSIQARVLPAFDSLAQQVARFGALIESGADASRLGRALGAALVDPVLPLLDPGITRIVIVPDGPLHYLPFDALQMANGRYVLERFALGFAPSASVVAALWQRPVRAQTTQPLRLLALGNPTLPASRRATAQDADHEDFFSAASTTGALTRLAGAAREARLVARYADGAHVRVGGNASAAFLKSTDLSGYRVLHFATHAIVDEQSVARTALVLAPGDGESGFVGAGDLAALRLDADLVVLSACRAARGVLVGGEGVQGMTSPLLQAGARALVATHWRIRDQDVVPFVDAMYGALARGLPVADAIRAAKLQALQRKNPPRTWAAFLAIGDPMVTIPLRAPPKRWWSTLWDRR
ncbi:MAG: CHAT domain-containing protein [Longimicrobiales bacterium]